MGSDPYLLRFGAALLVLAAIPACTAAFGQEYYVSFVTRVLIFGLAATSLNLILGYGGMVSFGHAAFFGCGAYAVAAMAAHGMTSAWVAWPAAVAASALLAAAIGAASLRTRGLYFIMITLAFAQMVYHVVVSMKALGGDDGLPLAARSTVLPGVSLQGDATFYYVVLAIVAVLFVVIGRMLDAPFGRALQAIRENESRMEAIGYPVFRIKLAAFVIAGAIAGLAGVLFANLNGRVGPGILDWPQSGTLMVMVILGGVGHRLGGFLGAAVLLGMEEFLPQAWNHWQMALGVLLLVVVLRAPGGIGGLFAKAA
ncbi:MAG TPA: branched-chain amino acid ABC transporter permease [Usitatibacter sp.]|nr:branched-chain amino acid ABC transporter permease [Usitatibacter sp.]